MTTVKRTARRVDDSTDVGGYERVQRSISLVSPVFGSFPLLRPKHMKLVGEPGLCVLNCDVWMRAKVIEVTVLSRIEKNSTSPGTKTSEASEGLLIIGGSGCGKTMRNAIFKYFCAVDTQVWLTESTYIEGCRPLETSEKISKSSPPSLTA